MDEHLLDVATLIAKQPPLPDGAVPADRMRRLCVAAAGALTASGVGLSVMADSLTPGLLAASDPDTERLEELQFTIGEGPCVDAFARRRPVLIPELDAATMARWPVYAPAVHSLGVRAVFAFPLQIGAARFGVLDIFRGTASMLSDRELSRAFAFADVALATLMHEPDADALDDDDLGSDLLGSRAEVFQAQGMVTGQLGLNLADALARMQAYAYLHDRPLGDVAADIVAGRLHLESGGAPQP